MSGWWAAGLWAGGLTVLVLILALCRVAKLGDQPDPEGAHPVTTPKQQYENALHGIQLTLRQLAADLARLAFPPPADEPDPAPSCCECGTTNPGRKAFYENHCGQLFCWPCADGDLPAPDERTRHHNEAVNQLAWRLTATHKGVGLLPGEIRCSVDGERMPCAVQRRIRMVPNFSGARFTD